MYRSLISTQFAQDNLDNPKWCYFDCRYELSAPEKKKAEYYVSHIPGALYVHMNQDLAIFMLLEKLVGILCLQ